MADQRSGGGASGLYRPQPVAKDNGVGLAIQLVADQLGAVKSGDKVYYRKVAVGRISGYELAGAGDQVVIHADIAPRYAHLVRKYTPSRCSPFSLAALPLPHRMRTKWESGPRKTPPFICIQK